VLAALLFDFDGLLYDSETAAYEAWREFYAEQGAPFPRELWRDEVMGRPPDTSGFDPLAHLEQLTGIRFDRDAVLEQRAPPNAALFPHELTAGAAELLAAARARGLVTAIVTSNHRERIVEHLARAGSGHPFDLVVSADGDAMRGKPRPTLYLEALAALGVAGDEAIVFEDSPNGIAAARAAGIYTVAVPNALTAGAPGLELADETVASLAAYTLPEDVPAHASR
jgi:HAD superfamily hydrolase (TIGR01509 family)